MALGAPAKPASYAAPPDTWRMFDRIARRYDLLNRALSFRRDVAWRKAICRALPDRPDMEVIDLATGTADVIIEVCRRCSNVRSGVGLDMSANMLTHGRMKISRAQLGKKCSLIRGDAVRLGLADNVFDAATIAFGIRNVENVDAALKEMFRIVKPGGRAIVLEFSLPANKILCAGYLVYFRKVLPFIGGLVSGDRDAYRYLNTSAESFPSGEAFCSLMKKAGFNRVQYTPLTFGIATLYTGDK